MASQKAAAESRDTLCLICNAPFREPMVLPCLHHYCKECIQGRTTTDGFRCPKCEKETTLPENDVNKLPTVFFIEQMRKVRDTIAEAEKGEVKCSSCLSSECDPPHTVVSRKRLARETTRSTANAYCFHPMCQFICESCERSHRTMRAFRDHKVVKLEELKQSMLVEQDLLTKNHPTITCPEHSQPREYHCFTCEKPICCKCLNLKHRDHECDTVEKASKACKEALGADIRVLGEHQERILVAVREAEKVRSDIQEQKKKSLEKVNEEFTKVEQMVELRRKELLDTVCMESDKKHSVLHDQLTKLTPAASEVQRVMEFTERCLHCACDAELLSLHTTLLTKIQEEIKKCGNNLPLDPPTCADIAVNVEDCAENVKSALQQYAQLAIVQPIVEVKGDGIHGAKTNEDAKFTVHVTHPESQPCKNTCTHRVEARLKLKSEIAPGSVFDARVVRLNPGTYEATYSPTVRGRHQLDVYVDGCQATGSPFEVRIECPPEQLGDPIDHIKGLETPYGAAFDHAGHLIVPSVSGKIGIITKNNDGHSLRRIEFDEHSRDKLDEPTGIAVDKDGCIYITDESKDGCIKKYDRNWRMLQSCGKFGSKAGEFNRPGRITINQDKLYICDRANGRVQVFDRDLKFLHILSNAELSRPVDVAFDSDDNAYITDHNKHQILKFNPKCELTDTIGKVGSHPGELKSPRGILVHRNFIYVTERDNKRVSVFKMNGEFVTIFGSPTIFHDPGSIVVDEDGFLYVSDQDSGSVFVF